MNPPRDPAAIPWAELVPLLDEALARDGAQRDSFLRELEEREPKAAAQLRAILEDNTGPSFLDSDAVSFAAPAWQDEPSEGLLPGGHIGPYRIVRRLAVGGMSTVHLVERDDDQFERTAVLKVLDHVGLDPKEAIRRFEAERQILATLDHPNIASVYDGGVTPEGRPYLILEYVPGEPITEYCAKRTLSVAARLDLFETVCRAVQHAHRRLVVHRDIKPGNILVREDGTVKLLDFGIAKILDDTNPLAAPATRTGLQLLTPEYAAPEQIRGGPVTSATDVYALGVLLHELLTGTRPHALTGLSPAEVERTVCDVDPKPPSTRATDQPATGLPRDTARTLRGDLDTIVLTALRKEPTQRYDSPGDLANDLRRHRTNLPIEARAASLPYRMRRFLRRHRIATGVAAAVVAFGVFHIVQITRERNHARQEALKAEQVAQFLKELFEVADPDQSHGESITARDLLDRASVRIRSRLADQPEVRSEMLYVLGDLHKSLSLYRRGVPLVEEAYLTRSRLLGETHPETARALELLGILHLEMGHYETADSLLERSLAARRDHFGDDHLETSHAWQGLGVSALNQNEYARADSCFTQALRIRRRSSPTQQLPLARTLKDLGMVRSAQGNFTDAEPLLEEALGIRRRLLGDVHSDVYIAMTNLGDNLSLQGRHDEAIPLLREGTDGLQAVLGDAHSEVAEGLNVLGITFLQSGRYAEAKDAIRRAVNIRRALHGDRHPDVARGLNDLGTIHLYTEDYATAESLLRESLAINLETSDPDGVVVAIGTSNLGRALLGLGRYDEALDCFARAESSHARNFGDDHIRVARSRGRAGEIYKARGEMDRAEALYAELLPKFREAYPNSSPWLGLLLLHYGDLLLRTGRTGEALPMLEEAEQQYISSRGEVSMETAKSRLALAHCLIVLEEWDRARIHLDAGLAVVEHVLPQDHATLHAAWRDAATLHAAQGRSALARDYRSRIR